MKNLKLLGKTTSLQCKYFQIKWPELIQNGQDSHQKKSNFGWGDYYGIIHLERTPIFWETFLTTQGRKF